SASRSRGPTSPTTTATDPSRERDPERATAHATSGRGPSGAARRPSPTGGTPVSALTSLPDVHPTTRDLLAYIQASPTPHHCVAESARRLREAGFEQLDEASRWELEAGAGYFLVQGGALL